MVVHERKKGRTIQKISIGNWFNTKSAIARQFSTEHDKDLSWHLDAK